MKLYIRRGIIAGVAMLVFVACSKQEEAKPEAEQTAAPATVTKAVAVLQPTANNSVTGTVTFTQMEGHVHVVADLFGLTPGIHGFHVHEKGDCSAPDASSAGGHYNPSTMQHSAPDSANRHMGDLGNIVADSTGNAHLDWMDMHLALNGENSIVGKAVIVHADPDDFTTQPTGNAGARVACGVIEAKNE